MKNVAIFSYVFYVILLLMAFHLHGYGISWWSQETEGRKGDLWVVTHL
jgi:hypothetical protein